MKKNQIKRVDVEDFLYICKQYSINRYENV